MKIYLIYVKDRQGRKHYRTYSKDKDEAESIARRLAPLLTNGSQAITEETAEMDKEEAQGFAGILADYAILTDGKHRPKEKTEKTKYYLALDLRALRTYPSAGQMPAEVWAKAGEAKPAKPKAKAKNYRSKWYELRDKFNKDEAEGGKTYTTAQLLAIMSRLNGGKANEQ